MDSFASKVLNAVVKMILILAPKIYTCGGYFSRSDNPGKEGDVRLERSQELLVQLTRRSQNAEFEITVINLLHDLRLDLGTSIVRFPLFPHADS